MIKAPASDGELQAGQKLPGGKGKKSYQRAHLLGRGLGLETPLGVFYAPHRVNQKLQEKGIEKTIRQMYAKRYPGARFFIRAYAAPFPGTELLRRVEYTLFGQLVGEPEPNQIFQYKIIVGMDVRNPKINVLQGEPPDLEVLSRYTNVMIGKLAAMDFE